MGIQMRSRLLESAWWCQYWYGVRLNTPQTQTYTQSQETQSDVRKREDRVYTNANHRKANTLVTYRSIASCLFKRISSTWIDKVLSLQSSIRTH